MDKKIILLSTLLCTLTHYVFGAGQWFELKPSYFFFSASPLKDIYKHGGFAVQGSVSIPVCRYLDAYSSVGYCEASGHALGTGEPTRLMLFPFDIGLKPVFNFCERFYYFFAIGPRCFYLHQHNYSPYVDCSIHRAGVGLFVNTGLNIMLADCFILGIFGEYSYENKKICPSILNVFSNGSVQLSSFAFGGSLGYAF